MASPSSSQETELEYITWPVPDSLPVSILRRVQDGIHQDVTEAFAAAPHRGPETGGILLGHREADRIVIEDFEPVPSEHRLGPSYRLSDADSALFEETLEWFRGGAQPGLCVLGFYRSHTLAEFALSQADDDLMRTHFAAAEDLVLLVRPSLAGWSTEDFFICRCSRQAAAAPEHSPVMEWPPPRPRLATETEPQARRRWPWYAGAIALGLAGGALGYFWMHPPAGPAPLAVTSAPAATTLPPSPTPPAARPIVEGTPAPPAPDIEGVRALLDRWAVALKRGDMREAAQCYAPVVATYYTRHHVTREEVRRSLQQERSRYGRLSVYRISGVGITPVDLDRAVAVFRKHWRITGRGRSSGTEEERMTLVRTEGAWHISSEQTQAR